MTALGGLLLSDSFPVGSIVLSSIKGELFLFRGFLSYFNITEFKPPTDRQKRKSEIDCLKSSISFKPYGFKEMKTNAVAIIIEHKNPYVASEIANMITKAFFKFDRDVKRKF